MEDKIVIPKIKIEDALNINDNLFEIKMIHSSYIGGNISFNELLVLNISVSLFKPKNILEFGTFTGRTTLNLIYNAPVNTRIVTVDLPTNKSKSTKYPIEAKQNDPNIDESGYVGLEEKIFYNNEIHSTIRSRIIQIWKDTAEFESNKKFDFIFVDASHSYENVLNDGRKAIDNLSASPCIIFFHDYGINDGWPGVRKALNELYEEGQPLYWIEGTSLVMLKK